MPEKPGKPRPRLLSGMRPTGKLHLGNYVGALQNWVKLQETYDGYFFVADWHALTTDYDDTSRLAENTLEVVIDYLGAGLDPEKCAIFVQSHVKQHAELHLLFSMMTPLGWLERVPTYKEQQVQMPNKDLHMYGFLGYPLLMAADILMYRPQFVPVGEDQDVHVELTREVARRFNQFYKADAQVVFPEPQTLLTPAAKLLGMDKRKMSKSYGNSILLSNEASVVAEKIKNSVTDRPKLTDHGNPDRCPVGNLHQIFSDKDRLAYITHGCTQATITCVECKALATESVNAHLAPIRERRRAIAEDRRWLKQVIEHGAEKAIKSAEETMSLVRKAVGVLQISEIESIGVPSKAASSLRVPDSILSAKTSEEQFELRSGPWLERVSQQWPLRKDKPRTYITRRGRKVGVQAAAEQDGSWKFEFEDRPLNVMVLLAEDKDRFLHDYVLPPKVVQERWKGFSRQNGNVSVTVRKSGDEVHLVAGDTTLPIDQYKGDYSALQ